MAAAKYKSVQDYILSLDPHSRQIIEELDELIRSWQPQLKVKIWHSMSHHIIGYGEVTYKYSSGRLNNWLLIGLAAHKRYLSLYICGSLDGRYLLEGYRDKLGKVKVGKGCINFKSLEDLKLKILQEVVQKAVDLQDTYC